MPINIDFAAPPPTLTEIAERRQQAVTGRAHYRTKNIRFTVTLLSIVIAYVTLMIIYIIPMITTTDEPDWGIITYFIPYFTFAIFVIGNDLHIKWIEKPSKLLDKDIADLNEAPIDDINAIINDKKQSDEITSYLKQLTAQGRSLIQAELDAIKKWHDAGNLVTQ